MKARSKPALIKKAIAEAKGGTYKKADVQTYAGMAGIEKARKGSTVQGKRRRRISLQKPMEGMPKTQPANQKE